MNNKGFTLIELLATVALLAIIVTISFVSINSMIKQNKVNNCETIVNNLKSATSEYVSDNRYKDLNINNFTAKVLVDNNYLKGKIKNPFNNSDIKAEDIKILIELNDDYTLKSATITAPNVLKECKG